MTNVSIRLKKAIEDSGLSYRDLSQKTGIPYPTIQRYAVGATEKMPISRIKVLASALGTSPEYLLGWDKGERISQQILPIADHATNSIPLIGQIACGTPILAEQNIEEKLPPMPGVDADMALRCKGDSMKDAGIYDGDIAYIKLCPVVDNGSIAAVQIGTEATLKRFTFDGLRIILKPENKDFPDQVYQGASIADVKILGKLVGVMRRFA